MTDLITDLTSLSLYQKYAQGTTSLDTVLAKNILAIQSTESTLESTVLTLGSTGEVHFTVRGADQSAKMFVDDSEMLHFTSADVLNLSGSDASKSTYVSTTLFQYDSSTLTNKIVAGTQLINGQPIKKNFEFDSLVSEFTGSTHTRGDALINGDVLSRSLNVFKTDAADSNNVSVGFGFRITERDGLELYKYSSNSAFTQRIATFGDGDVLINDSYYDYPIFGSNVNDYEHVFSHRSNASGSGSGGFAQLWNSDGANIFYNSGKVSVGDSTLMDSLGSEYIFSVEKEMYVDEGILVGTDGIHITPTQITNVDKINFKEDENGRVFQFDGSLSSLKLDSIVNDATNETWLRNQQNEINLSGFNKDMFLDSFFTGSGRTWFDKSQETIKLNDFDKTGLVFSNVAFENGVNFSGEISDLGGISEFGLTNFTDDIVTKTSLHVDNLSMSNVTSTVSPSTPNVFDIGAPGSTFKTAYVDAIKLTGDTSSETIKYNSNTDAMEVNAITFGDGSTLTSAQIAGATSDFEYADFENLNIFGFENEAYQVNGTFIFSSNQNNLPADQQNRVYIYLVNNGADSNNTNQVLFNGDGEVDTDSMILRDVSLNAFVDILLVDEAGNRETGKYYVTPFSRQSANEIVDLNTYVPNTIENNAKFFSDLQFFYNDYLLANPADLEFRKYLPYGYTTGQTVEPEFVRCILHSEHTKSLAMLMELNTFYSVPLVPEDTSTLGDFQSAYFFDEDIEQRLAGFWYYKKLESFGSSEEFVLYTQNDYKLFPKITFRRWKNTLNQQSTVSLTPYVDSLDWFTSDGGINVSHFSEATYRNLFQITVRYLKYGNAFELSQEDQDEINEYFNNNTITADKLIVRSDVYAGRPVRNSIMFDPSVFTVTDGVLSF